MLNFHATDIFVSIYDLLKFGNGIDILDHSYNRLNQEPYIKLKSTTIISNERNNGTHNCLFFAF